jgi:hypothetical protein
MPGYEKVPAYDAYAAALLLSQVHARAQADGISSICNFKDRESYICKVIAEAKDREARNIFKVPAGV